MASSTASAPFDRDGFSSFDNSLFGPLMLRESRRTLPLLPRR